MENKDEDKIKVQWEEIAKKLFRSLLIMYSGLIILGVLPSVYYFLDDSDDIEKDKIMRAYKLGFIDTVMFAFILNGIRLTWNQFSNSAGFIQALSGIVGVILVWTFFSLFIFKPVIKTIYEIKFVDSIKLSIASSIMKPIYFILLLCINLLILLMLVYLPYLVFFGGLIIPSIFNKVVYKTYFKLKKEN